MLDDPDLHSDEDLRGDEPLEDAGDRDVVPGLVEMNDAMESFKSCLVTGLMDGYAHLDLCLGDVPVPRVSQDKGMTVGVAIAAGFISTFNLSESQLFNPTELLLFKHSLEYKWTVEELKKVITMLKSPEFITAELDTDMSSRMDKAIRDGRLTCHAMREVDDNGDSLDGAQDLNFWMRDFEEVIRELVADERFAGHQHFRFEITRNKAGERVLGPSNGAMSFQIAQEKFGSDCVPLSIVIYIDGSFVKDSCPVKPIYGWYQLFNFFLCIA